MVLKSLARFLHLCDEDNGIFFEIVTSSGKRLEGAWPGFVNVANL